MNKLFNLNWIGYRPLQDCRVWLSLGFFKETNCENKKKTHSFSIFKNSSLATLSVYTCGYDPTLVKHLSITCIHKTEWKGTHIYIYISGLLRLHHLWLFSAESGLSVLFTGLVGRPFTTEHCPDRLDSLPLCSGRLGSRMGDGGELWLSGIAQLWVKECACPWDPEIFWLQIQSGLRWDGEMK